MIPIDIQPVSTARLFYGQWTYCIKIFLREMSVLRNTLDADEIERALIARDVWRQDFNLRWPGAAISHPRDAITPEVRDNCKKFADFLKSQPDPYKIVISVNRAWIYTNSLDLLERVYRNSCVFTEKVTQATVTKKYGVVELKNPRHTHRSYLKCIKLTVEEKNRLHDFLISQPDIRISRGLLEWLDVHWTRCQDYYFVDHQGEQWVTMLNLVRPGLIRRTLTIVAK